jgi:hypothetical protein
MKLKVWLGVCAIFVASIAVVAQEQKMSPDQKAAMDAMMKAATPGEAHKRLSSMAGTWDTTVKMWMDPNAPPHVSTGTSVNKWVLGRRWMQQTFNGTFMGQPFHGVGYTGYDNVKGEYVGTWMDTASTSMMVSTGKAEDDKTYSFSSTMADPVTKKSVDLKTKVIVADKNHHTMEMWGPGPDGNVYKMMEINYTRATKKKG